MLETPTAPTTELFKTPASPESTESAEEVAVPEFSAENPTDDLFATTDA